MSKQIWRYKAFADNTALIQRFCDKYGFKIYSLNNGYQLRVENIIDVYPVRQKYHILRNNERGEWATDHDLRQLLLKALPITQPPIIARPEQRDYMVPNVTDYGLGYYNKWYRRLWRRVRGIGNG